MARAHRGQYKVGEEGMSEIFITQQTRPLLSEYLHAHKYPAEIRMGVRGSDAIQFSPGVYTAVFLPQEYVSSHFVSDRHPFCVFYATS